MKGYCRNKKCRETLNLYSDKILCPACSYLARWMFALGAFVAGAAWTLYGLWR